MDRKFEEVVKFKEQKTGKVPDADVQYLEHKESTTNRGNSKPAGRSGGIATPQSQQAVNKRPIRLQMRADNSAPAEGIPKPKAFVHGATSMTPEQVKQLQENFGDDSQSDGQPRRIVLNERRLQTPSRVGTSRPEPRSQRNLRSAGPKPKSPSPATERWTDKNPDWADDWKTDLVYERTVVSKSDVERLDEGQLLNDEIITFYLKYLHKQLEERDAQLAERVYFFNSFFWEKLKPKRGTVNYDGVKNWTAKVDLFSFDYIIVPINEHMHWYVAIVCNAKELLSFNDTPSETDEHDLDKHEDQAERVGEDELSKATANDTMKKIAVDVSLISIEDDAAETPSNNQEEMKRAAAAKKTKAQRKGNARKYDPKATRVIALDSLGGTHSAVSTGLKVYLQHEIEAKKGLRVEVPATIGMSARDIPNQPNFTDCGVYLLGYMREFMKDPDKFATNILQREERTWNFDAPTLRNEIRNLIFKLQKDYQQDQEQQRRQRAQTKRPKPKSQGSATASGSPFRSCDEPAVRESPAPPRRSAANSRQATPKAAETSLPQAPIDQYARPADQEPLLPPPSAGDTAVNNNNVSMIVNVDESIEDAQATRSSTTATSNPVESIELDNDDAPEPPAARRTSPTRHITQGASIKTATPGTAFDERKFLALLPSSPPRSSPAKAESHRRSVNREGPDVVKTPGSHTGSVYTRKHGATKGRVTKTEVIPSSSEEEAGGKGAKRKKKKSPTIDLTLE
jgi:sentrin-specific protease 7